MARSLILTIVLLSAVMSVLGASLREAQFQSWMRQYGKSYGTIALRQQKE